VKYRQTQEEVIQKELARAEGCFTKHQIVDRSRASVYSWRLHKPYEKPPAGWDGTLWFEVVVFWNGTMLVHGDIDHVMFGHYGRFKDPEQVVRWMGGTRDFAYYVAQKACIGMGSARDCLTSKDMHVFLDRVLDHVESTYLDGKKIVLPEGKGVEWDDIRDAAKEQVSAVYDQFPEWLQTAFDGAIEGADFPGLLNEIQDHGDHDAWESGVFEWGDVPSVRLVYAYQALKRLVQLLDAEHEAAAAARKDSVGDGG